MESAARVVMIILLLGLGLIIIRSSARRRSPLTPETPRSKRSPEQEIEIDQNSTSQSSSVPASTDPPITEQNGSPSPFNQSAPFAPQQAILPAKKSMDYTVGWICAIVTEYAAAQEFLDEEHEAPDFVSPGDTNHYTLGRIREHNVVIAVLPDGEYGTAAAAMVATNMQNSFPNIRIGLLVGIGGGVPSKRHDIRLGDVVVSAPRDGKGGVFQYDFGKTMQGRSFQHTRFLNQPPTALRTALTGLQARYKRKGHCIESTIHNILNHNPGLRHEYGRPPGNADTLFRPEVIHNTEGCAEFCASNPSNIVQRRARTMNEPNPAIHYGLIASANQVMKDALVRDQLAVENDILCFEMEAAGLMNQFPCLVIRGICDYSDSHKNKEWQGFAAMTAAAYAKDILHQIPPSLVEAEKKISEILIENQGLAKQTLDNAKKQLEAQNIFAKERMSDKEEKCHQLFRLTSDSGDDATYEWYKNRVEERQEKFQEWLQAESGPLLVSADPGCGNYLPRSATICYFFFKDKVQDKVRQALCALLHQLFSQKPYLIKHAMPEYTKNGEGLINSTESLWKVLRNAIGDPHSGPIIMVLDALDECSELEFPDLTQNVESQCRGRHGKLKYLLTCRPYESIVSRFGSLLHTFPKLRIPGEEESEAISYEVNHVITHRINQLSQKKNLSAEVRRRLEEGLRKTPHRTYLWVYLVFNYLEEEDFKKTVKGAESALRIIPTTVNAAYEQILNKSKNRSKVRKVLSIILAASQPLTISEMNVAVNVEETSQSIDDLDLEDEEDFKSRLRTLCGLFISIYQGRIHFLHQTAREFLLGDLVLSETTLLEQGWFHSIAITQAHEVLATVCVRYLNFLNCDTTISANADKDNSNIAGSHDFLHYSATTWTTHFREAGIIPATAILPFALGICDQDSRSYAAWFGIFWETTNLAETEQFSNLMLASYCGHCAIARVLLEQGADVECKDTTHGRTPLSWAAEEGHEEVVKLLIQTDMVDVDSKDTEYAEVNSEDHQGRTPLSYAAEKNRQKIVKLLAEKGAEVNSEDHRGRTPLSYAAQEGWVSMVRLLMAKGADVNSKDHQGRNPVLYAAEKGWQSVVRLLGEI
ncbi:hypothetical protein BJX65DRAFT_299543 [Aspergillus insuetus]